MENSFSIINIGLVGGGALCTEILERTTSVVKQEEIEAPIVAVADPDPSSPGVLLAQRLGLQTFADYHHLYDPRHQIDLIIILTPDPRVLEDILATRPTRIRILSYPVFGIFWKAIGREERKLRERTREMETLVNGIQDFILVITPDMSIVEANDSFLQKMGYSRDAVIGRKCYDVYSRGDESCGHIADGCPLKEVVHSKRQARQIQKRIMPDGELRFYEVNIHPIWEKDGKISKFIHISRDITQHRREEEEITHRLEQMVEDRTRQLRETHEKLLHQDKMSSLGKLSASVVHEINNPIAGILNLVLLIKRIMAEQSLDPKTIAQFNSYLDLMETETRRTGRIVSNLLAFSRQPIMEMRRVNMNRMIEHTLLITANLLKIAGVRVDPRLEAGLPEIVGSEDQLQQVFINLLSNAAEAMEPKGGGVLRIETCHVAADDTLRITFADTGVGILKENMLKLFEPFFTTKKKGQGVGLGLSVAYGIIQEHGGSITVESTVGEGTIFNIHLPVRPLPEPAAQKGGRREHRQDPDRR
jgi:two-component system NtrC family sensor kinase